MVKEVIKIPHTPKYPFSPAIKSGDYIFVSGQGGFQNWETGEEVKGIEAQTKRCLENIKQILEAAGSSLNDVVKVTIFLGDAAFFTMMNDVYRCYFFKDYPARSTVVTGLTIPGMLIEMECIAYCPSG